jgi:hypothetical protein
VPRTEGVSGPRNISRGDRSYPAGLIRRFGADAPTISVIGPSASLSGPITAFLCSKESPGATILKALDQAVAWRDAGRCVISGFHSPLERECLNILLRGTQPIVKAAARAVRAPRLPAAQRRALNDGRLTIVSPFSAGEMRTTKDRAFVRKPVHRRNGRRGRLCLRVAGRQPVPVARSNRRMASGRSAPS